MSMKTINFYLHICICAFLVCIITMGNLIVKADNSFDELNELNGGIYTYYLSSTFKSTAENGAIELALGEDGTTAQERQHSYAIDAEGKRIALYNKNIPVYNVTFLWYPKNYKFSDTAVRKSISVDGTQVEVAYIDNAVNYADDETLEKMLYNTIRFSLNYEPDYDYHSFAAGLIERGIFTFSNVVEAKNFRPNVKYNFDVKNYDLGSEPSNSSKIGEEFILQSNIKVKRNDIYSGKTLLNENIDGNQGGMIGESFTLGKNEVLALDIKETTEKMPRINYAIWNSTKNKLVYWSSNAQGGKRYTFVPKSDEINDEFKLIMSADSGYSKDIKREVENDIAYIEVYTFADDASNYSQHYFMEH